MHSISDMYRSTLYWFYIFIHADQTTRSTVGTRIDVGIAIVATVVAGTITLVIGVLTGVLVYHCISKHRSHSSSSQQQHQGPQYEEVPVTVRMDKIEVKDNIAYGPVMHWLAIYLCCGCEICCILINFSTHSWWPLLQMMCQMTILVGM